MSTFYIPLDQATREELIEAIRAGLPFQIPKLEERLYEARSKLLQEKADAACQAFTACKLKDNPTDAEYDAHRVEWQQLYAALNKAEAEAEKFSFCHKKTPPAYIRK